MNYFIFNGKNSKDKGIIITEMPQISKPAKRVDKITVPGRNGVIYQEDNSYESIVIQIKCALIEENININQIKKWLDGEGRLILSTSPYVFYNANIINKIDYKSIANIIHEFPLELELQPFSYTIEEYTEEIINTTEHSFIIQEATAEMYPYIKVEVETPGQINLTINNETMVLNVEDYIELDCELMVAHRNYESKDDAVLGNFYKLYPGENIISVLGNYKKIGIKYRKAYL